MTLRSQSPARMDWCTPFTQKVTDELRIHRKEAVRMVDLSSGVWQNLCGMARGSVRVSPKNYRAVVDATVWRLRLSPRRYQFGDACCHETTIELC